MDIFLIYASLVALAVLTLFALILPYFLVTRLEAQISNKISEISVLSSGVSNEFTSLKTDISRLKFDHYEELLQKLSKMNSEIIMIDSRVQANDKSLKDFYSKWATRLGSFQRMIEAQKEDELNEVDQSDTQSQTIASVRERMGIAPSGKKKFGT